MRNIKIKGKAWKVLFKYPKAFTKEHGACDMTLALTKPDDRKLLFRRDECDIKVVRHELAHAYYAESMTESADLDPGQVQEVYCSLIGEHLPEIEAQAQLIMKDFNALRRSFPGSSQTDR